MTQDHNHSSLPDPSEEERSCLASDADRIRPYTENPYYWQYQGAPVLLLGGTWQDNLFNYPEGLERHLDRLKSVGGNYVRNTMSHRKRNNAFPYAWVDGKFDLTQWNEEYWRRFESFLEMTWRRAIIVQIEIWDPWDHFIDREDPQSGWSKSPFNPNNNVNYTAAESGLPTKVDYPAAAGPTDHTFFHTVPGLLNNRLVLPYQQAFMDKILSHSLRYPNILYTVCNEIGEPVEWSDYWAHYIRDNASKAGKSVEVSEMRRNPDITAPDHRYVIDRPELYTFLDISQNNAQFGETHWSRIQEVRALTAEKPRPLNNTKIYTYTTDADAPLERWWRILFGGCASSRFHRPHPLDSPEDHEKSSHIGLGLSPVAQMQIRSARMFFDAMNGFFSATPHNDLLSDRADNGAYCFAVPGREYAVYFPNSGSVKLDLSAARDNPRGTPSLRWLDIEACAWTEPQPVQLDANQTLTLSASGKHRLAFVQCPDRQ